MLMLISLRPPQGHFYKPMAWDHQIFISKFIKMHHKKCVLYGGMENRNQKEKQQEGEAAVGLTLQRATVHPPCQSRLWSPAGGAFDEHF